ncbi:MAG: hypothetical protein RSC76_07300 [Oscillospiraceae bacterium]
MAAVCGFGVLCREGKFEAGILVVSLTEAASIIGRWAVIGAGSLSCVGVSIEEDCSAIKTGDCCSGGELLTGDGVGGGLGYTLCVAVGAFGAAGALAVLFGCGCTGETGAFGTIALGCNPVRDAGAA